MENDTEARRERIKHLRREEKRIKELRHLMDKASGILQTEATAIDVLSIDEIDQHQILINSADFEFNYLNLSYPTTEAGKLQSLLISFADICNSKGKITLSNTADIFVFKSEAEKFARYFEGLITLGGDTISFCDDEYKNGLMIDMFREYWYLDDKLQYLWIYELRVFGKEWIKTIVNYA